MLRMWKYNSKYCVADVTGNRFPVRPKHRFVNISKKTSLNSLSVLLIYSMKAPDIFRQDVTIVYVV